MAAALAVGAHIALVRLAALAAGARIAPNGQEGKHNGEGGALALPAFDPDRAAHALHKTVRHRQAHAAAAEAVGEALVFLGEGLEDFRQERFVDPDTRVRHDEPDPGIRILFFFVHDARSPARP